MPLVCGLRRSYHKELAYFNKKKLSDPDVFNFKRSSDLLREVLWKFVFHYILLADSARITRKTPPIPIKTAPWGPAEVFRSDLHILFVIKYFIRPPPNPGIWLNSMSYRFFECRGQVMPSLQFDWVGDVLKAVNNILCWRVSRLKRISWIIEETAGITLK